MPQTQQPLKTSAVYGDTVITSKLPSTEMTTGLVFSLYTLYVSMAFNFIQYVWYCLWNQDVGLDSDTAFRCILPCLSGNNRQELSSAAPTSELSVSLLANLPCTKQK